VFLLCSLLFCSVRLGGRPSRGDVERAVWLADNPRNTEQNMPPKLPPRLARKVSRIMEESSEAGAGPDGPVDFWKWANGRLAEERVRARVPPRVPPSSSSSSSSSSSLIPKERRSSEEQSFDLDNELEHVRSHLPEGVSDHHVARLRSKWEQLDPEGRGRPTREDVARSVWIDANPSLNGAHNMPNELPPHLERKVTETMARTGNGTTRAAPSSTPSRSAQLLLRI
jgi:hypothetical protein